MRAIERIVLPALFALTTVTSALAQQAHRTERFQLKNGLKVILRPVVGAKQAAVFVVFRIGSNQDPDGRSGMAHLIEHLYATAAAGETKERTADEWMAGGKANAQTGEDYTLLAEVVDAQKLEPAVGDAAARMESLQVSAALLDRERQRVLDEVNNMFGNIPALGAFNRARERARPTPRHGRRGGAPDQIPSVALEEIRDRLAKYYKPANATLVIAGALDAESVHHLIERRFGSLPAGSPAPPATAPDPPVLGRTETVSVSTALTDQSAVCAVYPAPSPSDKDYPAFLLLTGRMMQNMFANGTKAAEPDAVRVQFNFVEDPLVVGISSGVRKAETKEQSVSRLAAFVASQVKRPLVPQERITTMNLFGPLLGALEVPDAQWAGNPYALGLSLWFRDRTGLDSAIWKRTVESLTRADVQRCAERFFSPGRSAAVLLAVTK
jgi:zinc protease